ncbi:MAG TPA: hypothetical protein VL907_11265 [Pyrinomonadaceae bacterium]|nr:hypothetical protein [Pyrinomonadaceae bacterium]
MKPNAILLRRQNKIIIPTGTSSLPVPIVATFNKNLEVLGYTLSPAVLQTLGSLNEVFKPDLFSLFTLHARARGTLVNSESDADTVFSLSKGITPYQLDLIAAEFL